MTTLAAALRGAAVQLRAAGIASPARDARLLMAAALATSIERVVMDSDRTLDGAAAARFAGLVGRRAARQPLSQILGRREFWSLDFAVTADTLTPRPESEEIVAAVLSRCADRTRPRRLLDLGCGTACLLLSLLSELPGASGIGVDCSAAALEVARHNAQALGLAGRAGFVRGDWAGALHGAFDVIVSNPPYIASADIAALDPEVRDHEPRQALDGGADGLDAYRRLAPQIARLLAPGGVAALELGAGQADGVAALMRAAGLETVERRRDLAGHERCLVLELQG